MPDPRRDDREAMELDVVIVGGGPSGLSCAIRLKQLADQAGKARSWRGDPRYGYRERWNQEREFRSRL